MTEKTRIIDIYEKGGAFSSYFKKFTGQKQDYNYSDMAILRQIFSNEKARILSVIKIQKPNSIYRLAKHLGRDFKSVRDDILLLKKFGFIELVEEKSGNRKTHKPILSATTINIVIRI